MKTKTNMILLAERMNKENDRGFKIMSVVILWMLVVFTIAIASVTPETHANELSIRDQIRVERLTACQEAFNERKDQIDYNYSWEVSGMIVKCAIRMHGVYIVESATGKHEIRNNNFLWLKRTVNWVYGFHSFKNGYETRLYFAQKYFQFHYKKPARQFIYGFWIDNQWKFGWSTTDKETYTLTLQGIEADLELKRQYEYLYITN